MNRRLLAVWVVIFLSVSAYGQKEANYWFFGLNAGLNFNTTIPSAVTNGSLVSTEGSAVMCSPSGLLLFYTNGQNVWGADNLIMPNGSGLLGSTDATQSCVVIPRPGYRNRYFIFTLDQLGGNRGLRYNEVDMTQNHNAGDVISKNIPVTSPLAEKLTAIRHNNGTDYWILVHGIGIGTSSSTFYAYKVTADGPASSPVSSETGNGHGISGSGSTVGYMKFSPNGKKVACAIGGSGKFIEVFDFNDATGKLSNSMTIDGFTTAPYGIEFSPDSKRLYVTAGKSLFQYTIPEIHNTSVLKFSQTEYTSDAQMWALQLGPDHKIYVCKQDSLLGIINYPNNPASSIGFTDYAISLGNRIAVQGFPNTLQNLLADNFIVAQNTCVNQPTQFHLLLNGLDSAVWDFGNVQAGTSNHSRGLTPSFIYTAQGVYNVAVTIYNNGYSQTINRSITINPLPAFSLGSDTTLCKGQSVNIKLDLSNASYLWNNGNKQANRILTTPGVHFVDATVEGCTVRDSIKIAYNIISSEFSIDKPTQCFKGNKFSFNAELEPLETNIWLVDDITAGAGNTLVKSFASAGKYKIVNLVTSAIGCTDSTLHEVTVNEDIKAGFNITVTNNCGPANRFKFTDNTDYSGNYTSEFIIEGRHIPKKEIEWNFNKPGIYDVKIISVSNDGCSDEITKQIDVYEAPESAFDVTAQAICDINNQFTVKKQKPLKSYETIEWHAENKKVMGIVETSFTFSTPGMHKIIAVVTNTAGCKSVYEREVEVFPSPAVNFTTTKNTVTCLGSKSIEFVNTTSCPRDIVSYSWDFGDNTTSALKNPVKDYSSLGASHLVSLTATNDKGCSVTAVKTITTYEKPEPAISVNTISNCETDNYFSLTFTNNNSSAVVTGYNWEDEKGKKYFANPLPISFDKPGEYVLNLKLVSHNGCEAFASTLLTVKESPRGEIAVNNNEQCLNDNAFEFKANLTSTGAVSYAWSLGDGTKAFGPVVNANYANAGNYKIGLEVTGQNGCKTIFNPVKVSVHPVPAFNIVSVYTCDKQAAQLKIDGLDNTMIINEWLWDLGDGQTATLPQPIHKYPHPGTYSVTATATSNYGCKYTAGNANGVHVLELPTVDFSYKKTLWGFDETLIEFTPEVSADVKIYAWDFGNGVTSEQRTEKVNYEKAGYYYVSLEGKSDKGCAGKITKQILIVPPFDAYVPTSFTPNGDGKNDDFGMEGVEFIKTYHMQIFNRWGQELFSTTELLYRWDGRSNGKPMPPEMYSYVITITDAEGRPYVLNGTIQLIR